MGSDVSPSPDEAGLSDDLRLLAKHHDRRGPADATVIRALEEAAARIEALEAEVESLETSLDNALEPDSRDD